MIFYQELNQQQNGYKFMDKEINVAYVIVDNLGGITSLIQNLIINKDENTLPQELHLLNIKGNINAPAFIDKRLNKLIYCFKLYPKDNWYHVYKKLSHQLNKNKGILISNDQYDLVMLKAFNIDRKVIQIVHDEYNLSLSIKFENCIDKFIAHSLHIYNKLSDSIPNRKSDIAFIHYGIPIQQNINKVRNIENKLNLLFLGRHVKDKGIFDLYEINTIIKKRNIEVNWTILGKGPETEKILKQWKNEINVTFKTPYSNKELFEIVSKNDILILPTKFEGFPVSILESMSVGCVPLTTDIPGGIQEIVIDGITGYKCRINDNFAFADKIELLHNDRSLLTKMQQESIHLVENNFDVKKQSKIYQSYFEEVAISKEIPYHHSINKKIGSRLDHKLIPNFITRILRNIIH